MKKFLSMFAFAAAIVLGAFTLASCDNDDDLPKEEKHHFTMEAELTSTKPEVVNNPNFQEAAAFVKMAIKQVSEQNENYGTKLQADMVWNNLLVSKEWTELVDTFKKTAKAWDDTSMKLTVKMIMDGKSVYKEQTYDSKLIWVM